MVTIAPLDSSVMVIYMGCESERVGGGWKEKGKLIVAT